MKNVRITLLLFVVLTVITGVFYPIVVTVAANTGFPSQASGSFVKDSSGNIVGSELIGQMFTDPKYFWPRPSAVDYNPMPSGASNLAVSGKALQKVMAERITAFFKANPTATEIPADTLFASGSGLDPHISVAAAKVQVDRVVKSRQLSSTQRLQIEALINKLKEGRSFFLLGEPRINVLKLNLALDSLK
jgi:K+-transporting ATPase ATPase C chain